MHCNLPILGSIEQRVSPQCSHEYVFVSGRPASLLDFSTAQFGDLFLGDVGCTEALLPHMGEISNDINTP